MNIPPSVDRKEPTVRATFITSATRARLVCCLLAATSATFTIAPPEAQAHQADSHDGHKAHRPGFDPRENRSAQRAAFEFRAGPYAPRVDTEFSGSSPYDDVFGSKRSVTIGFEVDYQALRIPHFGTFGPGGGWHWFRTSGVAPFADGSEGSAHQNVLWIMPMYVVGVLRVDVFSREWNVPLVPYVKGGFAFSLWESRDAGSVSKSDGDKARGISTGLQYQLGMMLHLNPLARQAAIDLDNSSGVNNAYLFGEWWSSDVDSFGKGMQTGDNTWILGIALEF